MCDKSTVIDRSSSDLIGYKSLVYRKSKGLLVCVALVAYDHVSFSLYTQHLEETTTDWQDDSWH